MVLQVPDVETAEDTDAATRDADDTNDNPSQTSTTSEQQDICRICHSEGGAHYDNRLISPCLCLGSLKYVHVSCIQSWIRRSGNTSCELCLFSFILTTKTEPFCQWKTVTLTSTQTIHVALAVMCHAIIFGFTLTAVYWFLDRSAYGTSTTEQWTFWKSSALAGCLVAELFLVCVHCKICFFFLKRWRSLNSAVMIESVSDSERIRWKVNVAKTAATENTGSRGTSQDVLQEVISQPS